MSPHTRALHQTIIRLLKGILSAWERWLNVEQSIDLPGGTVEEAMNILSKGRKPKT